QLHAVVGELALAALAVLAGAIFAAVDGALRGAPDVLPHTAADLVLRLGRAPTVCPILRVIFYFASWRLVIASSVLVGRGSRPPLSRLAGTDRPWPKRRTRPRVAKRRAAIGRAPGGG